MLEHLVARGYAPNGGVLSPEGVFCLNIPKNASTFLTNLLVNNGWKYASVDDAGITNYIVILRDPAERWVSGFATYAASWILGPGYGSDNFKEDLNDLSERVIFDQIVFDDHTTPQVQFIQQLNSNIPVTYFAANLDLVRNLEHFLNTKLEHNSTIDSNATDNNYDTKQIATTMDFILQENPKYKASVVGRYQEDYNLIRSINFYNYYNESR